MGSVRYRNVDTDDVLTYCQQQPLLERSDRYARVGQSPAKSDTKDVWVAHAQAAGVDVDGMTKDEIIEAVS